MLDAITREGFVHIAPRRLPHFGRQQRVGQKLNQTGCEGLCIAEWQQKTCFAVDDLVAQSRQVKGNLRHAMHRGL